MDLISISSIRERRREILRLRDEENLSFEQIAERVELSVSYVNSEYRRLKCILSPESGPFASLSVRAQNALYTQNITTKKQLKDAILKGKLTPNCQCRNFGNKTFNEVCKFVDVKLETPVLKNSKLLKMENLLAECREKHIDDYTASRMMWKLVFNLKSNELPLKPHEQVD